MRIPVTSVAIVLPYADAEKAPYYAGAEAGVDFIRDPFSATRCTLCFAATELKRYLGAMGLADVCFSAGEQVGHFSIFLSADREDGREAPYWMTPLSSGVRLTGETRVGALYAAYEFLKMQGIRWYFPGPDGEVVPCFDGTLAVPDGDAAFRPAMTDVRGLDVHAPLKESAQFRLWMARNRMNVGAYHPATAALTDKLGMVYREGGHIFDTMLQPDTPLSGGGTVWEKHPEWYGLPEDGVRRRESAMRL